VPGPPVIDDHSPHHILDAALISTLALSLMLVHGTIFANDVLQCVHKLFVSLHGEGSLDKGFNVQCTGNGNPRIDGGNDV
jgi:hypothetical protein